MTHKYLVSWKGDTAEEVISYAKALEGMGYKPYDGETLPRAKSNLERWVKSYKNYGATYNILGNNFPEASNHYVFQGVNAWERDAALAIAAISEDDTFHTGEWVWVLPMDKFYDNCEKCPQKILIDRGADYSSPIRYNLAFSDGTINSYGQLRKATPEELIEFFKNKQVNTNTLGRADIASSADCQLAAPKKQEVDREDIIGYRIIKDGPGFKKGLELRERAQFPTQMGYRASAIEAYGNSVKFPDGVLADTEWFEPIFKEREKVESLTIGSRNDSITISSLKDTVSTPVGDIDIATVRELVDYFTTPNIIVTGFAVSTKPDWRFIRIGCDSEDHRFSIEELVRVIETYNELRTK